MRRVAVADFFRGLLATALEDDELLAEVAVPAAPRGWGFGEIARRPGDFALAGVAASLDADGHARRGGIRRGRPAGPPARGRSARGGRAARRDDAGARGGGRRLGLRSAPTTSTPRAEYRRHLATVLTEDALRAAVGRLRS